MYHGGVLILPHILAMHQVPLAAAWLLEDIATFRGKQELYAHQSPERLAVLRESALIESAVSSTRMEQVLVDESRIGTILFGSHPGRDRNEDEVRGYRRALDWIHAEHATIELSPDTIQRLHRHVRADTGDAGDWKERAAAIVERHPDGRTVERFMPPGPEIAVRLLQELCEAATIAMRERVVPIPVLVAVTNLDFLCLHPFRDGNGRVSRLLLLLQLYHAGYEVGRYVSIERIIEQSKDRYYETLHTSSQGWHEGRADPWEYVNYTLYTLREAYGEFEQRWQDRAEAKGAKTARVLAAIERAPREFTLVWVERECPGVSRALIRKVLREAQGVSAVGRGPGATWRKDA